jgi:hypothetical protein
MSKTSLKIIATRLSAAEVNALGASVPNKIAVVSDQEAESAEYIACVPANWPVNPVLFLTQANLLALEAPAFRRGVVYYWTV